MRGCYSLGFDAHERGDARVSNPYPIATEQANAWFAGWDESAMLPTSPTNVQVPLTPSKADES